MNSETNYFTDSRKLIRKMRQVFILVITFTTLNPLSTYYL